MHASTWGDLAPYAAASGGWLLAIYFMRLVFSGRMVPRSLYLEQKEVAEQWREAFRSERAKNRQVVIPMAEAILNRTIRMDTGETPTVQDSQDREG